LQTSAERQRVKMTRNRFETEDTRYRPPNTYLLLRFYPHRDSTATCTTPAWFLGFAIPVLTEWIGEWLAYWRKTGVV
jgi:hypothetical protein